MHLKVKWHIQNVIRRPYLIVWYLRRFSDLLSRKKAKSNFQTYKNSRLTEIDMWFSKKLFNGMSDYENKKSVDWIIPDFSEFSGGHKTISRMCRSLEEFGIESRFLLLNSYTQSDFDFQSKLLKEIFNLRNFSVQSVRDIHQFAKVSISTSWESSIVQYNYPSPEKLYFIQDAEFLFNPASSDSALAYWTYSFPTRKIVLGKWLSKQIELAGSKVDLSLDFGVSDICKSQHLVNAINPKIIIIYCQPSKPRRGSSLIFDLLESLGSEYSDYKVYLVGETFNKSFNYPANVKLLGALSEHKMLSLFKPGVIGLVISHSNPSLVPFEMLNRGMLVCTNNEWSNLVDLNHENVEFFAPLPSEALLAIKRATIRLNNSGVPKLPDKNFATWNEVGSIFSNFIAKKL